MPVDKCLVSYELMYSSTTSLCVCVWHCVRMNMSLSSGELCSHKKGKLDVTLQSNVCCKYVCYIITVFLQMTIKTDNG